MLDNPAILWMLFGFILVVLEFSLLPAVGCIFAGMGAISTYVTLEISIIEHDFVNEIAIFALATAVWAALLWLPLKHLSFMPQTKSYKNIIGSKAAVCDKDLVPGIMGMVEWAGTRMKARLTDNSFDSVRVGQLVIIVTIKDNILYVTSVRK